MTDTKYYHVSPTKNIPGILRLGLRPGWDGLVHLSTDIGRALQIVAMQHPGLPRAVWCVTGMGEPQHLLTEDGRLKNAAVSRRDGAFWCDLYVPTSFFYRGSIPPERVTLVREYCAPEPPVLTFYKRN